MNIIAIDLGKFNSMVCFYETTTQEHSFAQATTERGYFRSLFENHDVDVVVMEACGPSGWVPFLYSTTPNAPRSSRYEILSSFECSPA